MKILNRFTGIFLFFFILTPQTHANEFFNHFPNVFNIENSDDFENHCGDDHINHHKFKKKPKAKFKILEGSHCESPCDLTIDASFSKAFHGKSIEKYLLDLGNGEKIESTQTLIKVRYIVNSKEKEKNKKN